MTKRPDLPAGSFTAWLRRTRSALRKKAGVAVPCGTCTACCTSSQFIHIRPEETRTLAVIPKKYLSAAPGLPRGHWLLGYFENGRCPLLAAGRCSIYAHRPLTCRAFDCRVFTAAGIAAGDPSKTMITRRVRSWKFSYRARRDHDRQAAVKAAARFISGHAGIFSGGVKPSPPGSLAVLALKSYAVFLKRTGRNLKGGHRASDLETAHKIIEACRKFSRGRMGKQSGY
jgi:uncharacterized protein